MDYEKNDRPAIRLQIGSTGLRSLLSRKQLR